MKEGEKVISIWSEMDEKIQTSHKIRFLTAYEIFAPENTVTEKLATYNNTIKAPLNFSDSEAPRVMY